MSTPANATPLPQRLPYDADFQKTLLKVLCEEDGFAGAVMEHIEPTFFENEVLAWAYSFIQRYREQYESVPAVNVIRQQARQMDAKVRPMYEQVLEQVAFAPLTDLPWLREQTLEFVKKHIFVRGMMDSRHLFNAGKVDEAYDIMQARMDKVMRTNIDPVDESWFMEDLAFRHNQRMSQDPSKASIGTGFPSLDNVLSGGLSKGELGIWVAWPKRGKSTILINHGVAACRQFHKVAHFVLEGSRQLVENRYDACFMQAEYNRVKMGDLDEGKYSQAYRDYYQMRGQLIVRGYTDNWDCSILDIHEDLRRWKRESGFVPDLVIVDYGDLLAGRKKDYHNETAKQKDAFRDLKSLASKGYALWSASQAQRPSEKDENTMGLLKSRQIADCYEKVRVADFLGSINSTNDELSEHEARLYAELYRDNEANQHFPIECDFSKMIMRQSLELGFQTGSKPPPKQPANPEHPVQATFG